VQEIRKGHPGALGHAGAKQNAEYNEGPSLNETFSAAQATRRPTVVLGIDPGSATGALAVISIVDGSVPVLVDAADAFTVGVGSKQRIDPHAVAAWVRKYSPSLAGLERSQAFPRQGRSSAFSFGHACGMLQATIALCEIPLLIIEPSAWKKFYKLSRDKEQSRQYALAMFPAAAHLLARRRDHGRAEAGLIAAYAAYTAKMMGGGHD
jgi:crossover junction endodeoxyribonuclease RuvC